MKGGKKDQVEFPLGMLHWIISVFIALKCHLPVQGPCAACKTSSISDQWDARLLWDINYSASRKKAVIFILLLLCWHTVRGYMAMCFPNLLLFIFLYFPIHTECRNVISPSILYLNSSLLFIIWQRIVPERPAGLSQGEEYHSLGQLNSFKHVLYVWTQNKLKSKWPFNNTDFQLIWFFFWFFLEYN